MSHNTKRLICKRFKSAWCAQLRAMRSLSTNLAVQPWQQFLSVFVPLDVRFRFSIRITSQPRGRMLRLHVQSRHPDHILLPLRSVGFAQQTHRYSKQSFTLKKLMVCPTQWSALDKSYNHCSCVLYVTFLIAVALRNVALSRSEIGHKLYTLAATTLESGSSS